MESIGKRARKSEAFRVMRPCRTEANAPISASATGRLMARPARLRMTWAAHALAAASAARLTSSHSCSMPNPAKKAFSSLMSPWKAGANSTKVTGAMQRPSLACASSASADARANSSSFSKMSRRTQVSTTQLIVPRHLAVPSSTLRFVAGHGTCVHSQSSRAPSGLVAVQVASALREWCVHLPLCSKRVCSQVEAQGSRVLKPESMSVRGLSLLSPVFSWRE